MATKKPHLAQFGFDFGDLPVVPTPTLPLADDPDDKPEPRFALALRLSRIIEAGEMLSAKRLMDEAASVFGCTLAAGRWSSKDAYDALEVAVNLHLVNTETAKWTALAAEGAAAKAQELAHFVQQRLPTQSRRDEETDEYQQFSTPPALAFVANWVAHVRRDDTLLEPSAGTADLAIWPRIAGAKVILNELSARRLALLSRLMPEAPRFAENAEQLDNVLPPDIIPTVIVMNPPFSSTAGRIPGERKTTNGAKHIEQALRRLAGNGRLVAIVGDGMAPERPAFRAWWREIESQYSVRANVGISGREYAKYGTTFDHRLLVIDKCGPTQGTVVMGRVASVADLPHRLESVRNARPRVQPAPTQPTIRPDSEGTRHPVQSGNGISQPGTDSSRVGTGFSGNEDDTGTSPSDRATVPQSGPGDGMADAIGTGDDVRDRSPSLTGGSSGGALGGDHGVSEGNTTGPIPVAVETVTVDTLTEFSDSVFSHYSPQRLNIPDSQSHPGKLVQSAAMAAVQPPAPVYSPRLPGRVINNGLLSLAQLEAVVYAGQAHSELLPNGTRKGFFIGDGTGVGKGREISGIILDNMMRGRTKAVWVSFNEGLIADARRDFSGIGGDSDLIFFQGKTPASGKITRQRGILFTTYSTLRGGQKKSANDHGQSPGKTRLNQIVEWLGQDFDGVVAFDEAHGMGNAIGIKGKRGTSKPSLQALAGISLQHELPQARVLYVSATGATEVSNLTYAERLGLWGEGTPFADAKTLINQVSAGGVTAMELISRDMKAMGLYLARSLSFDGVTYERLEHPLTDFQRDVYDELAAAWQVVLHNVNTALELTQAGHDPAAKNTAMSQFWGAHQRFFNQVITAMQTPSVIDDLRRHLDLGHAAVIQLVNTNEATQERIIAEATAHGSAFEELDFTPRQMLMDYVRNGFPIAAFEESADENGNKIFVPVTDAEGNPVLDRQAIAMRDALLDTLQAIRVPENPLDSIINAFGAEVVAEVTGRSRRFVQSRDEDGTLRVVEEKRGPQAARADAERFQNDKKRILLFSGAGGTGYSFHADNTAANRRKRIHYILQPGWAASAAVQGFGRTHRSNQAIEPHYVLPTTNLQAQKRFVSSIARRLDQLGALTQGQRQATSQGLFSAADNLESEYAATALHNLFLDLYHQRTPLSFREVATQMGLNLLDKNGTLVESKIPTIPQFLNRLLSLKIDMQNAVFDEFEHRLVEAVEYAKQHDTYDEGLQTLQALSIKKTREEVVYEKNDARTRYVELAVTHAVHYLQWSEINAIIKARRPTGNVSGWFVSEYGRNKGDVFFLLDLGHRINAEGRDIHRGILYNIRKGEHQYVDHADVISRGWDHRVVNGRYQRVELSRPVSDSTAEVLWNAQLEAAPKTVTIKESMLVGVILPLWDRVEGNAKIYRLQTDDGEQLLGWRLGAKAAVQTLRNLGLHSEVSSMPPSEWYTAIRDGQKAVLSNGWEMTVARVSFENRIEIKGRGPFTEAEKKILKDQGAFVERINWAERVFIPTGDDGLPVFERITASKPVIELFQARTQKTDSAGGKVAYGVPTTEETNPRASIPYGETTRFQGEQMEKLDKPYHQIVAEKLIEQLKAGAAPWQKPWEPGEPNSFLPMNPITGKRYKGTNAIHLMAQGHTDARWMTYKQAAGVGAQVRKGEKGTRIQYWKFSEEQDKLDGDGRLVPDAKGNPVKETIMLERPRLFFATVFNGEQIDGLPSRQRPEQAWDAIERAENILQASGATIRHGNNHAFYQPTTDSIHLPDQGQFSTANRYYATALHELAHWTGHESRLDRDLSHPFGSEGYAKEELRAEIASMIVGDELGIGHDPEQHAAYVAFWIKALEDDPLEIFRASAEAEKIHDYVLAFEQKQVQEQGQQQAADQRPPHEMTRAEFIAQANVEVLTHHGRKWNVTLGNRYSAFSDADSPQAALADVHWGAVNNALFLNTPEAAGIDSKPTLPPPAVLADYPDLVARYPQATEQEAKMQVPSRRSDPFSDENSTQEATPAADRRAEAWVLKHVQDGTLGHALHDGATLAQIDRVGDVIARIQPLNTQNDFWTRHELPWDVEPLEAKINTAMDYLDEQRRPDAMVAAAFLGLKTGNPHSRDRDREAFDQAADNALGFTLPHDWTGEVRIVGVVERNGQIEAADLATETPQAYHLYARKGEAQPGDDAFAYLAASPTLARSESLAHRLALIDANSEINELDKAAKLARVRQADPGSYINVPFNEKDNAKQLGARWDRQKQSWYVPLGVDTAPFAKWAQGTVTAAVEGRQEDQPAQSPDQGQKAAQKRVYLAVPYGERAAAKSAGAQWDPAAKSWYADTRANMARLNRWIPDPVAPRQDPALSPTEEFAEALRSLGCIVTGDHPIMDGMKHRIEAEGDKQGEQAGFYVGHLDGHPAGYIKNNRTGLEIKWKSKGYILSQEEKARLKAEAATKLAERAAEQDWQHETTAMRLKQQMETLVPVAEPTPYMRNKGIQSYSGVLTDHAGQTTYIPAFDVDGKQWTIQYIQDDGTKRFAKDSRKEGCFHPVGGMAALAAAPVLIIAEGYATAASLAEAAGQVTVAALDAGNLLHVARALHGKFPDKPIVIAGDDDRHLEATQGINRGRVVAEEAAKAVGGKAILPIFTPQDHTTALKELTDFNDLATKSRLGKQGIRRQINAAIHQVMSRQVIQLKKQEPDHQQVQKPTDTRDLEIQRPRRSIGRA